MAELHDVAQKNADGKLMQQKLCCECGATMTTREGAQAHVEDHWPMPNTRVVLGDDATRRRRLMLAMADTLPSETAPSK